MHPGGWFARFPDPQSDPDYLRDAGEYNAWDASGHGQGWGADAVRLFLANGGYPRSAPQPGTAEYRVAVEDFKAKFASCFSANPDGLDPNKVLGQEVQSAATEWQAEIASQQAQRDTILTQAAKATSSRCAPVRMRWARRSVSPGSRTG